jgi:uncharacterized delta-60 repeat protein
LEARALLSGGSLDPTFGSGGLVTTPGGPGGGEVIQSDGKLVMAGHGTDSSGTRAFRVARYNTDGSLDSSFGSGGIVTITPTRYGGGAGGVAIQSDGKIVAVGQAIVSQTRFTSYPAFAVVRYNANGTLDTTFGGGKKPTGIVVTQLTTTGNEGASSVVIQPDGKIVVAGTATRSGTGDDIAVVRYNPDGTLDSTFGSGGVVFTSSSGTGADAGNAVTLQSDGKIVVAGGGGGIGLGMEVARYLSNGQPDGSFGTSGLVTGLLPAADTEAVGRGVLVQSGGTIVVAGDTYVTGSYSTTDQTVLARLTSSGNLDTSFGNGGYAVTSTPTQGDAIALAPNRDLMVAGLYNTGTAQDFGLAAFLPGGTLDSTFGTGGFTSADFSGGQSTPRAVAIQSDGKIVLAGETYAAGSYSFALARFLGWGSAPVQPSPALQTATTTAPAVRGRDAGRTNPTSAPVLVDQPILALSVRLKRTVTQAGLRPAWRADALS